MTKKFDWSIDSTERYFLTDIGSPALHGSGFPSIMAAKNYAKFLYMYYGLCKNYSIGKYENGKFIEVYNSKTHVF